MKEQAKKKGGGGRGKKCSKKTACWKIGLCMNQLVRAGNHHQQQIKTKTKTKPQPDNSRHSIHLETISQTNKMPRHSHRTIIPSQVQQHIPIPGGGVVVSTSSVFTIIANLSESLHDPHFPTDIRRFRRGHRHQTDIKQQMQRSDAFAHATENNEARPYDEKGFKQKKEKAHWSPFPLPQISWSHLTNGENRITWAWRKQRREARSWA